MQAEFLCTVFLYYKKIITIPEGVWRGGASLLSYQIKIFYCTEIF